MICIDIEVHTLSITIKLCSFVLFRFHIQNQSVSDPLLSIGSSASLSGSERSTTNVQFIVFNLSVATQLLTSNTDSRCANLN